MLKTIQEGMNEIKNKVGISNRKWAEISGVSEGTVNGILSGHITDPAAHKIEAMLTAVGYKMSDLFDEPETPEQVQSAVIDHYSLLIGKYNEQIEDLKRQLAEKDIAYKERIVELKEQLLAKDIEHKAHTSSQRKALWLLFGVMILVMMFFGYLCVDALHCDWGMFRG